MSKLKKAKVKKAVKRLLKKGFVSKAMSEKCSLCLDGGAGEDVTPAT